MRPYERALPYLLLLPSIAFMLVFFAWPLVEAILVAFGDEAGGWTLEHFRSMADDINFTAKRSATPCSWSSSSCRCSSCWRSPWPSS